MPSRFRPITSPRGFILAELAAILAIILLMVVIALPLTGAARRCAMAHGSGENLHRYAAATTAYAADNAELFWATSWRKGMDLPTDYADLKNLNGDEFQAAMAQVIDILRRKAGRLDMAPIFGWIPQLYYSHLPLFDYMDQSMPAQWAVSPADRHRLAWAKDPDGFDKGEYLPCQPMPNSANKRWPYSSSYQLSPSFYDQSDVGKRIQQGNGIDSYQVSGDAKTYGYLVGQAAFPSNKVHLFEGAPHHIDEGAGPDCDQPRAFILPDARVAMLFVDGHSAWMTTGDANPGWQPNNPDDPDPTYISVPEGVYPGVYRWTRQGIAGRDYGGPEVGPPP